MGWRLRSWPSSGIVSLVVATLFLVAAPAVVRADEHAIAITDAGLVPDELTVVVGEPVTWTNQTTDSVAVIATDGSMDSGQLAPGDTFGHVFDAPGTVDYFFGGNPRVRGTIIVEGAAGSADAGGGNPLLIVGVSVLAAIAVGGALATLIGASRRSRPSSAASDSRWSVGHWRRADPASGAGTGRYTPADANAGRGGRTRRAVRSGLVALALVAAAAAACSSPRAWPGRRITRSRSSTGASTPPS